MQVFHKFLSKNTSLSTVSGLRDALWHDSKFTLALKTLSDGEVVAGTHKHCTSWLLCRSEIAYWCLLWQFNLNFQQYSIFTLYPVIFILTTSLILDKSPIPSMKYTIVIYIKK